jgi:glutamine synthetase type III
MVGILIVLIFLWFYNCVHQFGIIKKCLDTVDARYKHEDYTVMFVLNTLKNELSPSAFEGKHIFEQINFSAQSYMNMGVN